jgi:protein O-GlcNAc transferase
VPFAGAGGARVVPWRLFGASPRMGLGDSPIATDGHPMITQIQTLLQMGRVTEAEAVCRRAMKARPGQGDLLFLLGQILYRGGRIAEAVKELDKAAARRPDLLDAVMMAGALHEQLGALDKAEKAFRRVLAGQPSAGAWFNLGNVLRRRQRESEAVECYASAHRLAPNDATILSALVARKQALCDWRDLDELSARLVALVNAGAAVQPFRMLSVECSEQTHFRGARAWGARSPAAPRALPPPVAKDRLTVGYLSADYHQHATAYLAAELFELHDRQRVKTIAYSLESGDGSAIRARLEAGVDLFVDVVGQSSSAIADRIAADGVDILVDLKGYTRGGRPDILARRPAPVQVSYLGYPGTMGVDYIDYILADVVVLPVGQQQYYSERIVHLPHCYQVNDRQRPLPTDSVDRAALGLPAVGPVLACFNATYKIDPQVFAVWMRVLHAVPDAVLWLLADEPHIETALRHAAGPVADRLIFAPRRPLAEHLFRYRSADLFLDTLPYNAHTTGSDALWMGCPMVTCQGQTFAARVGASLLHAVGMAELVTQSLAEYEALVIDLLNDPSRLSGLRTRLEQGRATAPLFDSPAFTRAVESAYDTMWRRACDGLPPEAFGV